MLFLLALIALSSASTVWQTGTGNVATTFIGGNFFNASFFGADATFSTTDGTAHHSPMRIPSVTVDAIQQPLPAPALNITKSILGNFQDNNWFYNFPFNLAQAGNCGGTTCPNDGANPITIPAGAPADARAGFFQNGDTLTFDFAENIGAFGFSYGLRATDANPARFSITFGDPNSGPSIEVTPTIGGPLATIVVEPDVTPLHAATFNKVTLTFTNMPDNNPDSAQGGWFVFNQVFYGQTGYYCFNNASNTAALGIDLTGLPVDTTDISYDGMFQPEEKRSLPVAPGISPPAWITGVGNQKVIICVPPGFPVISVRDNGFIFRSHIDGPDPIVCGTGHFGDLDARCCLDPRANLTIPVPCVPEIPTGDRLSISLSSTEPLEFRNNLTVTEDPWFIVLASQTIYAQANLLSLSTAPGSYYSCRKNNADPIGTCTRTQRRGTIIKPMEFRLLCNDNGLNDPNTPAPLIPNPVRLNVTFPVNSTYDLEWLVDNVENSDQTLCVPAWGTYTYNAREAGVNDVQTDDAESNCSPESLSTRCNTTPLDLVSILEGPGVCPTDLLCDGSRRATEWFGANQTTGFPLCLSYNGIRFRDFNHNPFVQIRQCVLNLNAVHLTAKINTTNPTVYTDLAASYDCTDNSGSLTFGNTPGTCEPHPNNPVNFFQLLEIDTLKLPTSTSVRVDYVYTSTEDNQIVCSSGTLEGSVMCDYGDKKQHFCVPAVGSDSQDQECGPSYLPHRLEVVGQECPGGECFPANNGARCRAESEECINVEMPRDCRFGCEAKLGRELCIWDLMALPPGSQTVQLSSKTGTETVREIMGQGGAPESYWVLATEQRVHVKEASYEVSSLVDCGAGVKCFYNDFLSLIDYQTPIAYDGEQVLTNIEFSVVGLGRSPAMAGKDARNCRPYVVLADPINSYTFEYVWNGCPRTLSGIQCRGCGFNSCDPLPRLTRWFAVDPTVPSQLAYHCVIDGIGQVIAQDNQHEFKSYGNPWGALDIRVNGSSLCSKDYGQPICQPSDIQQPLVIYYALACNSETVPVTVNLGCDSETYTLHCPLNWHETGITECGVNCTNSTENKYDGACTWEQSAQVGPLQGDVCSFDQCRAGWRALQPMINVVSDLRCLPDGSSDLPSTLPTSPFNQNNYRGQNYTTFFGELTARQNPIDLSVCCVNCARPSAPTSDCNPPPSPAPGTSCDHPLILEEAGGFQTVFTGLYHKTAGNHLALTVQELFRTESSARWEEARPAENITRCDDPGRVNALWKWRIEQVRPTMCTTDTPNTTFAGPSAPARVAAYTYDESHFVSWFHKARANNEIQLKYTYSLAFLAQEYSGAVPTAWNVIRPHALLRPNKFAAFEDNFCVVRDNWYNMRLNDELVLVGSAAVECSPDRTCVTKDDRETPIPFQDNFFKKSEEKK